jgi:2TM domain
MVNNEKRSGHEREMRDFLQHLIVYIVCNIALVITWFMAGGGDFWPGWLIAGWGIGLLWHGASVLMDRVSAR